nr:metallophosphoesterase [Pseudomonas sp. LPH1]
MAWRFVHPLPLSLAWKFTIGITLLVISKYHYFSVLIYGDMWSPELPYGVVWILGWLFCAFVLLFVFTLLSDTLLLLGWFFGGRKFFRKFGTGIRVGLVMAVTCLSAFGVYQATQAPEVHRVELSIKDLPPEFNGFRFVQLSDLHISRLFPEAWVREVVERTNALKPELILITGDIIDGYVDARRNDVSPLKDLQADRGVIAIPGNHEFYFKYAEWGPLLEELGMRMLLNEHVVLQQGNGKLTIAGVSDASGPKYGFPGPDLDRALQGASTDAPIILLNHRPEGTARSAKAGVDVQLSGHTHGGMVRGLDQVAAYANEGFVSRRYDIGSLVLYVSNGTGLWMGFPIRLGVPPEITEFTLRPAR